MPKRFLIVFALALMLALPRHGVAQAVVPPTGAESRPDVTDNAGPPPKQTLEDILARQRGEDIARHPVHEQPGAGAADQMTFQLGTLGNQSDAAVWEGLRFGTENVKVSAGPPQARVVIQPGGMTWLAFRAGPLREWGGYALLGTIALLALFYLIRGRIRIQHGWSGITITRFAFLERFGHWLIAGSFLLLGATGLISLFGRVGLIPWMGRDTYAVIAHWSKLIHNNVAWAFMLGIVWVFVAWVAHNLPDRTDINWLLKGGGIIGKAHPPAKKFNAGQKLVFWAVVLLGGSISASGLSLLFPFDMPMFAATFRHLNDWGIPQLIGIDPLPTRLAPQEEMQLAQVWHAIVAFAMLVVILAHIYIGTIGMEGAFDAMGSGEVDLNWAKEHHSLWVEKVEEREGRAPPAPAE